MTLIWDTLVSLLSLIPLGLGLLLLFGDTHKLTASIQNTILKVSKKPLKDEDFTFLFIISKYNKVIGLILAISGSVLFISTTLHQ